MPYADLWFLALKGNWWQLIIRTRGRWFLIKLIFVVFCMRIIFPASAVQTTDQGELVQLPAAPDLE